ncbi:hypothetical protein [Ekhidna sp.]|uniref:hypothetical protein n=1 Tax=Ekhidna sp. TaxID=2608089 RepID=UPI003514A4CB
MNKRIKYLNSLIRRKRLADNKLLKMPIGKNSKIEVKTYLTEKEKLILSRRYLEYYRFERLKSIRIALLSIVLTALFVSGLVYAFMALI